MLRGLTLVVSLTTLPMFGSTVKLLSSLPNGAFSNAIKLDAQGNIYIAGSLANPTAATDAFVAKLSPDGSTLTYLTVLSGSSLDAATALTLGTDGSAYVVGYTSSSDFPVSAGALEPQHDGAEGQMQGFLTKLNPAGSIVYSTFINGNASTKVTGIAVRTAP